MKVHEEHKKKGPDIVNIALVIVSTSRYEEQREGKETTDKTIPLIAAILREHPQISLNQTDIVSDDSEQIKEILSLLLKNQKIHAIIFSGGTGFTPKDITHETIHPLLEKEITGFGEIFRYLSFKDIGPAAMLSRATAGKVGDKAVFLLPGSPKAVELAFKEILIPELRHVVHMITKME